jgi:hypothetical protein
MLAHKKTGDTMENNLKIGDRVVWGFCFDEPDSSGVVIGFEGDDRVVVRVEYGFSLGDGTDVQRIEAVMLESEWRQQCESEYA